MLRYSCPRLDLRGGGRGGGRGARGGRRVARGTPRTAVSNPPTTPANQREDRPAYGLDTTDETLCVPATTRTADPRVRAVGPFARFGFQPGERRRVETGTRVRPRLLGAPRHYRFAPIPRHARTTKQSLQTESTNNNTRERAVRRCVGLGARARPRGLGPAAGAGQAPAGIDARSSDLPLRVGG